MTPNYVTEKTPNESTGQLRTIIEDAEAEAAAEAEPEAEPEAEEARLEAAAARAAGVGIGEPEPAVAAGAAANAVKEEIEAAREASVTKPETAIPRIKINEAATQCIISEEKRGAQR